MAYHCGKKTGAALGEPEQSLATKKRQYWECLEAAQSLQTPFVCVAEYCHHTYQRLHRRNRIRQHQTAAEGIGMK